MKPCERATAAPPERRTQRICGSPLTDRIFQTLRPRPLEGDRLPLDVGCWCRRSRVILFVWLKPPLQPVGQVMASDDISIYIVYQSRHLYFFFKNMSYVVTHFDSDPIDSSCIWQVSLTKWLSRINCDSLSCIIHWVLGLCSTVSSISILYRYTHTDYTWFYTHSIPIYHNIPILSYYTLYIYCTYLYTVYCIYTIYIYIYIFHHFSTTLLHRGFSFADPIMEPGTWALTASIFFIPRKQRWALLRTWQVGGGGVWCKDRCGPLSLHQRCTVRSFFALDYTSVSLV